MVKFILSMGIVGIVGMALLGIGWVMNIVTLWHHANEPVTVMAILRAVGIFVAPLGGVLGYI